MLQQFKSWFRRDKTPPAAVAVVRQEPGIPIAKVETAPLSLAAILSRFPDDLKSTILQLPAPEVTVALPLTTIVKQLPTGSVKMSLASLHRQAPAGTFRPAAPGDKRMVEVPLSEVFKRVNLTALKRREDQRKLEVADGFDLFGDEENPYAIAPVEPDEPITALEPDGEASPEAFTPPAPPPRVAMAPLRMPEPMIGAPPAGVSPAPKRKPTPLTFVPPAAAAPTAATGPRAAAVPQVRAARPKIEFVPQATEAPTPQEANSSAAPELEEKPAQPPLIMPLAAISTGWPEPVRAEISALSDATVSLPAADISAGLAKGKVVFSWGQIRSWITPALEGETEVRPATELALPLKLVAPAFLKSSQKRETRERISIDETIPALFNGAPAPIAAPEPVEEPSPSPVEAPVQEEHVLPGIPAEPLAFSLVEPEPASPEVVEETPAAAEWHSINDAPETDQISAEATTQNDPTQELLPAPISPAGEAGTGSRTVGEILGQPEKVDWKPREIVEHLVRLPQIAGAVVALQEGLVVAHHLPEGMKGEVVAAFLPQIFARLNQYASEMKLGELDDLLFSTHGAHMQIFRLGVVYFAVLGKPGEALPWAELHVISQELARHAEH